MNTNTNNLDTLRERLTWRWSNLMQKIDWIAQDRRGRDPYSFLENKLLDQSTSLLAALEELNACQYGEFE